MIHFIKICGIVGILTLFVTVALAIACILAACLAKRRSALGVMALVSLLPLGLGLLGTFAGYSQVASTQKEMTTLDWAAIEHGRSVARYTTYLGAGCTGLLWLICGVGAAAKREIAEPGSGLVHK